MTRLEWVLKNREDSLEIRNRIVVGYCPSDYGLVNINCTDSSSCADCWNHEITGNNIFSDDTAMDLIRVL